MMTTKRTLGCCCGVAREQSEWTQNAQHKILNGDVIIGRLVVCFLWVRWVRMWVWFKSVEIIVLRERQYGRAGSGSTLLRNWHTRELGTESCSSQQLRIFGCGS